MTITRRAQRAVVWLLVLVSLLVAAIVALAIRKSAPGALPACARCVSDRRRFVGSVLGGLSAGVLLFVLGVAASSGALVGLGMVLFAAALLGSLCGDQFRVRGRVRKDLPWVELSGVAPEFAAELSCTTTSTSSRAALLRTAPPSAPPPSARPCCSVTSRTDTAPAWTSSTRTWPGDGARPSMIVDEAPRPCRTRSSVTSRSPVAPTSSPIPARVSR